MVSGGFMGAAINVGEVYTRLVRDTAGGHVQHTLALNTHSTTPVSSMR